MSGVSNSSSRSGTCRLTRQKSKCSGPVSSASSLDLPGAQRRSLRRAARAAFSSAKAGGTRQTGCRVPAANGLTALATSPARWLKITDLPMFVPPTTATTNSGGASNCGNSLLASSSNHSWPRGEGTPSLIVFASSDPDRRVQMADLL